MEKKRSIGVTMFGWILILYSIVGLIKRALFLVNWDFHKGFPLEVTSDWILVLFLIAGVGLVKLKNWGRRLVILAALIKLFFYLKSLYLAFTPAYKNATGITISFWISIAIFGIIYLLIIYYFTRPKVKEQFK